MKEIDSTETTEENSMMPKEPGKEVWKDGQEEMSEWKKIKLRLDRLLNVGSNNGMKIKTALCITNVNQLHLGHVDQNTLAQLLKKLQDTEVEMVDTWITLVPSPKRSSDGD